MQFRSGTSNFAFDIKWRPIYCCVTSFALVIILFCLKKFWQAIFWPYIGRFSLNYQSWCLVIWSSYCRDIFQSLFTVGSYRCQFCLPGFLKKRAETFSDDRHPVFLVHHYQENISALTSRFHRKEIKKKIKFVIVLCFFFFIYIL